MTIAVAPPDYDEIDIARQLGFDAYRYRQRQRSEWGPAISEGYLEAASRRCARQDPDRFERKWLQLRMNAFRRKRVVDARITPTYLRRIDVDDCPILRIALTHGEQSGSDWSIDRLNNEGAYAPHNLAVLSTAANRAKGNRSYAEVMLLAEADVNTDGLMPEQWLRLASVMQGPCFAEQPSLAPMIPLVARTPFLTARGSTQQIQYALTTRASPAAGKNALIKQFRLACRTPRARDRLATLAERIHQGLKNVDPCWDVWLIPGVMDALIAWRATMDTQAWAMAGLISMRLAGARQVSASHLLSWQLATHGYMANPHSTVHSTIRSPATPTVNSVPMKRHAEPAS